MVACGCKSSLVSQAEMGVKESEARQSHIKTGISLKSKKTQSKTKLL